MRIRTGKKEKVQKHSTETWAQNMGDQSSPEDRSRKGCFRNVGKP